MVLIVAHRGAPKRARENTVDSFLAAVSMGADMVELDVRRTGDGTLIVFHDPWLSRKTRRPRVADLAYKGINAWAAKKKFRVPTLEEAFAKLSGKTMLNIELKEDGYEAAVIALARRFFPDDKFLLTSFDPAVVAAVGSFDRTLTTGLILQKSRELPEGGKTEAAVLAPEMGLFASRREYFAEEKRRGKRIAVWTVDGREQLSHLCVDPLVDAIITNFPDRALAIRKRLCGA